MTEDNFWWQPLEEWPEADTRTKILIAAYKEIHVNGFQAASLNNILAHTGVTKGALYHHFPNKTELGYAVIEEVLAKYIERAFIFPLEDSAQPLQALIDLIEHSGDHFTLQDIQLGCPMSNLVQEMAPIDEGFRERLYRISQRWHAVLMQLLLEEQKAGRVLEDIDAEQVASMIIATLEGCLGSGMLSQNLQRVQSCGGGLLQFLRLIQK